MPVQLLMTKLNRPRLRPDIVLRPRLFDRLDAGLEGKLTLVSAPAGFGKTTLVSAWAHRLDRPAAWILLDEGDNDFAQWLAYVTTALGTIEPDVGEAALSLLGARQPPPMAKVMTALINDAGAIQEPFVLVLDDYHLITAKAVHEALAYLVDYLPAPMHLVIVTRADPPLPLARLRAAGQLAEIRQDDLRFTPGEAVEFFNRVMGLGLSKEAATSLTDQTEGWIAGLQLAALSLQGRADVPDFIHKFAGGNRFILDYLIEEVLQRQPESVQQFLYDTAVLDRMSAPLCDAVRFGEAGVGDMSDESGPPSQAMLERLERDNLFVVPLDDRRVWYRYHRLFADLLRKRLLETRPDQPPRLHRRAARWFERQAAVSGDQELISRAIGHTVSAGDFSEAARLVEAAAEGTLMRSQVATYLRWVETLPADLVRERPLLGLYQAWALLMSGRRFEEAERFLQQAAEADTAGRLSGEIAAFQAMVVTLQGDAPASIELAHRALEQLPESSLFLRSLVLDNLGIAYLLGADLESAAHYLGEAARIGQRTGNVLATAGALSNLAGMHMLQGRLRKADALYRQALDLAKDRHGRPLPVAGKALLGLGELARMWNDLENAARYFTDGIELVRRYGEIGAIVGYISLAFIAQAQGDSAGASTWVHRARASAREFDITDMDDRLVDGCQVRLWIAQGNLDAAQDWVEAQGLDRRAGPGKADSAADSSLNVELRHFEAITLARLRIAQGRQREALQILGPVLEDTRRLKRMRRAIETLILQALAHQAQGEEERALSALGEALAAAEPEGYVGNFVEEGQPMARLLYRAAGRGISPAFCGKLLAAFPTAETAGTTPTPSGDTPAEMVEPLSARELEVLRLLAEGLSNREIGGRLYISLSTVKGHTGNIYSKLGVHSRTQAIARARGLGILPDG